MERDFETNSSHLVTSRTALWCPVCGAKENQGCHEVKGLRFSGHNLYAVGQTFQPITPSYFDPLPARRDAPNTPRRRFIN
jgi:hypothetical protein